MTSAATQVVGILATTAILLSAGPVAAADAVAREIATLRARIAETRKAIQWSRDYDDVDNLNSVYNFYVDKNLWDQAVDLYARDGSMELAQRGVYTGQDRIRAFYHETLGTEGPTPNRLGDHLQIQNVIHIDPDGKTAHIRSRSVQMMESAGIFGVPRDWNKKGNYLILNPAYTATNGLPEMVISSNAGPSTMTPGGIIVNTALRGTYFGVGGTVNQLKYGATFDPDMIGGDWQLTQVNDTQSLHSAEARQGLFGRISYKVFDNLEVFFQGSWNRDAEVGWGGAQRNEGGITIRTDNAFVPASVRAALGTTAQFTLGSSNGDLQPGDYP